MSYIATNSQHEIVYTIIQVDNTCSSIESSYTWSNLIQDEYQFSVIAFTSKGPGEAASLTLSTLPNNGKLILYLSCNHGYVCCKILYKMDPLKIGINILLVQFATLYYIPVLYGAY